MSGGRRMDVVEGKMMLDVIRGGVRGGDALKERSLLKSLKQASCLASLHIEPCLK